LIFTNTSANLFISTDSSNFDFEVGVGIFKCSNYANFTKYNSLIEGMLNKICLVSIGLLGQNLRNLDLSTLSSSSRIV
jgi:hypothetical protein